MSSSAVTPGVSDLFLDFARYFELSLALTSEQKESVYRLRYDVYCEEFGYEDPQAFKDRQETDEFESQSVHCLVTHIPTGLSAGCVRLVSAHAESRMPMEEHCGGSLDADFFRSMDGRRSSMAEISRLAVDSKFRRRRGETESRFGNPQIMDITSAEQRTYPLIAVSLFLAAGAVAQLQHRDDLFAIMEPFLPVILRRSGIRVQRVGEDFDFRGKRAPYYINIDDAIRKAPEELRLCYEAIRGQFSEVLGAPRAGVLATTGSQVVLQKSSAPRLLAA